MCFSYEVTIINTNNNFLHISVNTLPIIHCFRVTVWHYSYNIFYSPFVFSKLAFLFKENTSSDIHFKSRITHIDAWRKNAGAHVDTNLISSVWSPKKHMNTSVTKPCCVIFYSSLALTLIQYMANIQYCDLFYYMLDCHQMSRFKGTIGNRWFSWVWFSNSKIHLKNVVGYASTLHSFTMNLKCILQVYLLPVHAFWVH